MSEQYLIEKIVCIHTIWIVDFEEWAGEPNESFLILWLWLFNSSLHFLCHLWILTITHPQSPENRWNSVVFYLEGEKKNKKRIKEKRLTVMYSSKLCFQLSEWSINWFHCSDSLATSREMLRVNSRFCSSADG